MNEEEVVTCASFMPSAFSYHCRLALRIFVLLTGVPLLAEVADSVSVEPRVRSNKSEPLFVGYMSEGAEQVFALADVGAGGTQQPSRWLRKGEVAQGLRILEFEKEGEILFVQNDAGDILKLSLQQSHVRTAKSPSLAQKEAKEYLNGIVAKILAKTEKRLVHAKLDFNAEQAASPAQKAMFIRMRSTAQETGNTFLVARRSDGLFFVDSSPPYPRRFLPDVVQENLTKADWEQFQLAFATALFIDHQSFIQSTVLENVTTKGR